MSRPRVLDDPDIDSVDLGVTNEQNSVVKLVDAVLASGVGVDTRGVEGERVVTGIDGDGDGAALNNSSHQTVDVTRGNVAPTGDCGAGDSAVSVADTISHEVRVALFRGDVAVVVLQSPLIGQVVVTTIATSVAGDPRAVNEGLRGQTNELTGLQEVSTLDTLVRAERPATTADTLILDIRDGTKLAPVDLSRKSVKRNRGLEELLGTIAVFNRGTSAQHAEALFLSQISEVVDGDLVGLALTVDGVNLAHVVVEDLLAFFALVVVGVTLAVLAHEARKGALDVVVLLLVRGGVEVVSGVTHGSNRFIHAHAGGAGEGLAHNVLGGSELSGVNCTRLQVGVTDLVLIEVRAEKGVIAHHGVVNGKTSQVSVESVSRGLLADSIDILPNVALSVGDGTLRGASLLTNVGEGSKIREGRLEREGTSGNGETSGGISGHGEDVVGHVGCSNRDVTVETAIVVDTVGALHTVKKIVFLFGDRCVRQRNEQTDGILGGEHRSRRGSELVVRRGHGNGEQSRDNT